MERADGQTPPKEEFLGKPTTFNDGAKWLKTLELYAPPINENKEMTSGEACFQNLKEGKGEVR